MKKMISALLAVVLAMSVVLFSGCAPQNPFVGEWTATLDLTAVLNEELAENEANGVYLQATDFSVQLNFSFKEDGTYTIAADEDSCKATIERLKQEMEQAVRKILEDALLASGSDLTVDAYLAGQGLTMEALMAQSFQEERFMTRLKSYDASGKYDMQDGALYRGEGDSMVNYRAGEIYEVVSADEIKLVKIEGNINQAATLMSETIYPMVLKRK